MTSEPETGSGGAAVPSPVGAINPHLRFLTSHKEHPGDTELNQNLNLAVLDAPGPGNACHKYEVSAVGDNTSFPPLTIRFQKGPIKGSVLI